MPFPQTIFGKSVAFKDVPKKFLDSRIVFWATGDNFNWDFVCFSPVFHLLRKVEKLEISAKNGPNVFFRGQTSAGEVMAVANFFSTDPVYPTDLPQKFSDHSSRKK